MLLLRGCTEAVSQEGHKIISLQVQTQQQRYSKTPKDVLLNSDRCTKQMSDLPFILRYVLRKSLNSAPSLSELLHPRKSSSRAGKETATVQLLWTVSYIVCRSKAVIIPVGSSHHYLACSLISTPLLPLEGCICYQS